MSETSAQAVGRLSVMLGIGLGALLLSTAAAEACGAYFARNVPTTTTVGTVGAKLFNHSTNMVVARENSTTTITMTADYRGDPKEFAVVIAVPTVLTREQIKTADAKLIDWLDKMGAPRLTETYDPDPCPSVSAAQSTNLERSGTRSSGALGSKGPPPRSAPLGVTVEAQYAVGEYDIAILSAEQSNGLRIWLNESGYNVPPAAEPVLASYIADGLKFFVAKVNLQVKQELGYAQLQPLQLSYQSPKFMVPVRLSTVNAEGPQEMFVHLLTPKGRVEAANYPTRTIPTNLDVPPFVKKDYPAFYKAVFETAVRNSNRGAVFIEHVDILRKISLGEAGDAREPDRQLTQLGAAWRGDVVLTRLHFQYDKAHFPNDLMLRETANATPYRAQFAIHHPYTGGGTCPEAARYRAQLKAREARETRNLTRLTGWSTAVINEKIRAGR